MFVDVIALNGDFCFSVCLQEKKGVTPDPAAREQTEIAKLDKILLMVRDPPEGKN